MENNGNYVKQEKKSKKKIDVLIFEYIQNNFTKVSYYTIIILGLFIRIVASLRAVGILHPDEIFQGLEMGHLLVYGSGYVPAEFQLVNRNIPSYAASRSWIFPLIFAFFFRLGDFLHLNYYHGTLPMIKIFLAINSATLIIISKKFIQQLTKNEGIAVFTAFIVAFWFRIVEYTVRPFYNTFFLPILFYAIYRVIIILERNDRRITNYESFIIFLGLGISTYVRPDLLIVVLSFFIPTLKINFTHNITRFRNLLSLKIQNGYNYIKIIIISLFGWLAGALIDFHYFREFFTVPIHWFTFNVILKKSDLFGQEPTNYYYEVLVRADRLSYLNFYVYTVVLIYFSILFIYLISKLITSKMPYLIKNQESKSNPESFTSNLVNFSEQAKNFEKPYKNELYALRVLLISTLITWLLYSNFWEKDHQSHKEVRFIINGLIVLLYLIGVGMYLFKEMVPNLIEKGINSRQKPSYKSFQNSMKTGEMVENIKLLILIILIIEFSFINVFGFTTRYHSESFDDVNLALEFVGQQQNLTNVIVFSVWFLTGSYTYLGRNNSVNIYWLDISTGYNQYSARVDLSNVTLANYVILPLYQTYGNNYIYHYLIDYNWQIVKTIDGRSEVWSNPSHNL